MSTGLTNGDQILIGFLLFAAVFGAWALMAGFDALRDYQARSRGCGVPDCPVCRGDWR